MPLNAPIANFNGSGSGSNHGHNGSQKPQNLQSSPEFVRHDWQIYITDLSQVAGLEHDDIRKLVLKELADNACDEMDFVGRPGEVTLNQDDDNTYTVTDKGRGFPDTRPQLAERFCLNKPAGEFQAMEEAHTRMCRKRVESDCWRSCARRR